VPTYGEIKYFYAWINAPPHIITVFNIVVVDLPPAYGFFLGRDWSSMIKGYIMNDGSCMMLPDKYEEMIKVSHESRSSFSFKKKDNELMEDYIDVGIENYAILDMDKLKTWRIKTIILRDTGGCHLMDLVQSFGSGVGIIFINQEKIVNPHAIRLKFVCTNNEAEYEDFIQGIIIAQEMKIEHLIVTGDSELVINQITHRYKIKKERLKLYFKRVNQLMESFSTFNISFIPRVKNQKALASS
jgi:ribonuclease HI